MQLVPLRHGTTPVGLLAAAGSAVDPGTLDAIAGVASIAIERVQFLEERKRAEVARKSEEMKSALLASLGHDLRTPLTAIRVAASNLQASWLSGAERLEQSDVVLTEVARLTRLFQNILDMARIDAGAVESSLRWVHPEELVEAARDQVEHSLRGHPLEIATATGGVVRLDPRLTAAALGHLLENAAQYSGADAPIDIATSIGDGQLLIRVRDHTGNRGVRHAAAVSSVLSRAYGAVRVRVGHGCRLHAGCSPWRARAWADNAPGGGAVFSIAVPRN